ncbi:MAG TPA: RNA polymerase sigma factor [Firmicutes bacterium]|nr:RNA polymerase sigma factor [Bacillota bacterium]
MSLEEALNRAVDGDSGALEVLIQAYEGKVYSFAYHLTGNADDARDLSQEVLLRVISSIKNFRGDCPFSSWVFKIANNVFIDKLRRKARLKFFSLDDTEPGRDSKPFVDPVSVESDPCDLVQRRELRTMVEQALMQVQPRYRVLLVMHDVHEMKYKEIAEALGCPVGTVKSRLNRARMALRMKLMEAGYVQTDVRPKASLHRMEALA